MDGSDASGVRVEMVGARVKKQLLPIRGGHSGESFRSLWCFGQLFAGSYSLLNKSKKPRSEAYSTHSLTF